LAKVGFVKKLAPYNKPLIVAIIGLLTSIIQGTLFPVFGLLMGKMMFVWMIPDHDELRREAGMWCLGMFIIALVGFFNGFI
jgi:ATP-binding cassette subfamily B (MDR/TAP) protein 1